MALENYQDISSYDTEMSTGFQFQFSCRHCGRTWKSPYRPYRTGQIAGLFNKIAPLLNMNLRSMDAAAGLSHAGMRRARDKALAEALELAAPRYTACPQCRQEVCADCFDTTRQLCQGCIDAAAKQQRSDQLHGIGSAAPATSSAPKCPNCQSPSSGGRFCAECGFDMASTHKSCPACGAMMTRQARFCTDCGHGF